MLTNCGFRAYSACIDPLQRFDVGRLGFGLGIWRRIRRLCVFSCWKRKVHHLNDTLRRQSGANPTLNPIKPTVLSHQRLAAKKLLLA